MLTKMADFLLVFGLRTKQIFSMSGYDTYVYQVWAACGKKNFGPYGRGSKVLGGAVVPICPAHKRR